jgi:iron-sulfur cluster repair protein YtfE (RIC family)
MIDNSHADRRVLDGQVDFTMMYASHDAFTRHLQRLVSAIEQDGAAAPGTSAQWELFKKQLHIHHTAEDVSLWPRLRAVAVAPDEVTVLDAMEMEHAQIDPQLERVDNALAGGVTAESAASLRELIAGLGAHMRHEENEALPLVERHVGPPGWTAFAKDIRKTQGLRGAAVYFPWLLDGADEATATKLLGMLPAPLRFLHRRVWAPKYRKVFG